MDGEEITQPQQLGFGVDDMLREQETAHLPGAMEEAIPYYRNLIQRHHAAMLSGDEKAAMAIREEAHELATPVSKAVPMHHATCWNGQRRRQPESFLCGAKPAASSSTLTA